MPSLGPQTGFKAKHTYNTHDQSSSQILAWQGPDFSKNSFSGPGNMPGSAECLIPRRPPGFLGPAEITGLWHRESQALRQEYRRWGWGTQPRVTSSPPFTQCVPRIPHNAPSPWAPVGHPRLWFGLLRSALWAGPKGCRNAYDKSATWCLYSPAEAALSLAPRLKQITFASYPTPIHRTYHLHFTLCPSAWGSNSHSYPRGLESITLISAWAGTQPPSEGHERLAGHLLKHTTPPYLTLSSSILSSWKISPSHIHGSLSHTFLSLSISLGWAHACLFPAVSNTICGHESKGSL